VVTVFTGLLARATTSFTRVQSRRLDKYRASPPPSEALTVTITMPPRGGTAWTSDRIRPPTHKPSAHIAVQTPSKSDKGKGRASTPEPPRSAAVRKLDELLAGLRSSSSEPTRSQRPQNSAKNDGASPAQDGCFCQGTSSPVAPQRTPLTTPPSTISSGSLTHHPSSPSARARAI